MIFQNTKNTMKKLKFLLLAMVATCIATATMAQAPSTLLLESRSSFTFDNANNSNNYGFKGEYFNLKVAGEIAPGLSYSWRQRINTTNMDKTFFDATDWLYLNYNTNRWTFSAGKQVVAIAGYEYDRAPIDIYFASEFWNHINCYQWGASATYNFDEYGYILAQVCQSPIAAGHKNSHLAYNIFLLANYEDWSQSTASLNIMEYDNGGYFGYLAFGERAIWGNVMAEIDLLFRGDFSEPHESESASYMFDLRWDMNDKWALFTHMSGDYNLSDTANDGGVAPHSVFYGIGAGVEYFPLGNNNLRLHAAVNTCGSIMDIAGVEVNNSNIFCTMGLTWRVNLLGKN